MIDSVENSKIFHTAAYPWLFVNKQRKCTLTLRTGKLAVQNVAVCYGDPCEFLENGVGKVPVLCSKPMELVCSESGYNYYRVSFPMKTHKLRYHFELNNGGGVFIYNETGVIIRNQERLIRPFCVPYTYEQDFYCAPDWVEKTVWYQIFPERFSGKGNVEEFVPERENFYGGTLAGVRSRLPYLKELGVNGIYLNPVFESRSNHKYDTMDYRKVDPSFGTGEDLKQLAGECHKLGIRIMLDGVYNHCGYDSPMWQDVLEKGKASRYYDWFLVYDVAALQKEESRFLPPQKMREDPPYECFAFAANMPKWNTKNPEVRDYLIGSAEYWTQLCQLDGWRLDVPDEIDRGFLKAFYTRMKMLNPNIYIIGEIWTDPAPWLGWNLFDGVMNYPLYFAVRDFILLGEDSAYEFSAKLKQFFVSCPPQVQSHQFNFCSNHDIPRALTVAGVNSERMKAAYLLLFLLSGTPCVYYGDELGMEGGEDPKNRGAMRWDYESEKIRSFFQSMISMRNRYQGFSGWNREWQAVSSDTLVLYLERKEKKLAAWFHFGEYETVLPQIQGMKFLLGNAEKRNGEYYLLPQSSILIQIKP